jgi:hypothetical protein
MTSSIPGSKLYSLFGQTIDMGSFIKRRTITTHIGPTQIIYQKENNIGLLLLSPNKSKKKEKKKKTVHLASPLRFT